MRRSRVVIVVVLLAITGASTWRWFSRPALSLHCSDGSQPREVVLSSVIAIAHGAIGTRVTATPDTLTTQPVFSDARSEKSLSSGEYEAVLRALECPPALPAKFGRSTASISVQLDCVRGEETKEAEAELGTQHHTFGSWVETPREVTRLFEAIAWWVKDLDPRPRAIAAMAFAALELSEPH